MKPLGKYVADLLQRIGYIEEFTRAGKTAFMDDIRTQEAVIRSYEVIGEIVKRISEDVLGLYPNVKWKEIKGFRDYLIHNYDQVDLEYVWDAVEDLPILRAAVEAMQRNLKTEDESP